jgi:transcriptional regulator with XRE-family HTH domain
MRPKSTVALVKQAQENETLARDEFRRQLYLASRDLSQRALAAKLGISQPAIAQRLRGYKSDYDTRRLETMRSCAQSISDSLSSPGDSLATRLRLVAQALSDFRSLTQPHDRRFFLREPASTGDSRWDALLASVAAREARRAGMPIPRWTTVDTRFLDKAWFPTETPSLRAIAFEASPAEFAIRNVYLDPAELESV